jgi:alkylation response protein AidB-like acyl-CoA dehydrogenase
VGKRLLQYERQRSEDAPARPGEGRPLNQVAAEEIGLDASGRLADFDLRRRLTEHLMDKRLLRLTIDRAAAESKGAGPSAATSILKNVSSVVNQTRAELLLEIYGSGGLGWEGEGFTTDALANTREWLSGKASTIYAGSYEIQNNIIAKRILGLPDPAGAAG